MRRRSACRSLHRAHNCRTFSVRAATTMLPLVPRRSLELTRVDEPSSSCRPAVERPWPRMQDTRTTVEYTFRLSDFLKLRALIDTYIHIAYSTSTCPLNS
eukprot:4004324-Pleurochrysis_carterae.AAC.2